MICSASRGSHHNFLVTWPRACVGFVAFCLSLSTGVLPAATLSYTPVALTSDVVAEGTFDFFGSFSINNANQVAFAANLIQAGGVTADDDVGIWQTTLGGATTLLHREGTALGGGIAFESFSQVNLSDAGEVASIVQLRGGGLTPFVDDFAVFGPGELDGFQNRVQLGEAAPNNGGFNLNFSTLSGLPPVLNGEGTVGVSTLAATGDHFARGVWARPANGPLSSVAVTNESAPGPSPEYDGATFTSTRYWLPSLSASGELSFQANAALTTPSIQPRGIWLQDSGGTVQLVAGGRAPVPDLAGAVFTTVQNPTMNQVGEMVFRGALDLTGPGITNANDSGLWRRDDAGNVANLIREGDNGPAGITYGELDFNFSESPASVLINAGGDVAFTSEITSAIDTGLFVRTSDGEHRLIARQGTTAPGTGGATFTDFKATSLRMNARGDLAFLTTLQSGVGGVDSTNENGIWYYHFDSDELLLVAREGDLFEVADGDSRLVLNLFLGNGESGGADGRSRVLNDEGRLLFQLGFDDGTGGLFTVVPEPSSFLLSLLGLLPLGWMACVRWRGRQTPRAQTER